MTNIAFVAAIAVGGWYVALKRLFPTAVSLSIACCWAAIGVVLVFAFGGLVDHEMRNALFWTLVISTLIVVISDLLMNRLVKPT